MAPPGQVEEKAATPEDKELPAEPSPGRELQSWRCLVCFLCFYGFMAQMRPGESFITPYLLGRNFTKEQLTNEITPVLSYAYLAVLVPIFLLTDYLRYKPVLLLQGVSYVCVWVLLLWGRSVLHMQLMEGFYSVTMAARIAYSSYIFSLVPCTLYQRMASYSRTAVLLGVFTSSVLGQLLVTVGPGVTYVTLHSVSLAFLVFSLGLALFLKRPRRSLFFHRATPVHGASPCELDHMRPEPGRLARGKLGRLLGACGDSFLARMLWELGSRARSQQLRTWSLWWVFSSAGYYLIVYYVHILWSELQPVTDSPRVYNGAADAASTLLGAITSFMAGFLKIRWALWSKLVIAVVTAAQAGLVFLLYNTQNIWLCYVAFVLFRGAHQFLVPIATFRIASSLSKELCALVFGINTFLATVLKTSITLAVSDKRGLGLPVNKQFRVYFVYFLLLSVVCFFGALLDGLWHFRQGRHQPLPTAQELRSPLEEKEAPGLSMQDRGPGSLSSPLGAGAERVGSPQRNGRLGLRRPDPGPSLLLLVPAPSGWGLENWPRGASCPHTPEPPAFAKSLHRWQLLPDPYLPHSPAWPEPAGDPGGSHQAMQRTPALQPAGSYPEAAPHSTAHHGCRAGAKGAQPVDHDWPLCPTPSTTVEGLGQGTRSCRGAWLPPDEEAQERRGSPRAVCPAVSTCLLPTALERGEAQGPVPTGCQSPVPP
ncbi:reduced folate transporter [Ctenodactylus gundi]